MARIKQRVERAIVSRAEFEALIGDLSGDIINEREIRNDVDAQILEVRKRYEDDLAALAKHIESRMGLAQEYADAHPEMFPKDRKSIELVHALVGYRTGTPSAKPMRGWTWDAILDAIRERGKPWRERFITMKESPNKEALIAARETHPLDSVGVQIVQAESFFVEPKLEPETTKLSSEAASNVIGLMLAAAILGITALGSTFIWSWLR